jgi:histone-lysine N-methyltransferase SETMAR
MLTIVWNPRGFRLIKVLKKGRKFNGDYYPAEILEPLSQWCSIEAASNERKLLMHADNARPHTAKLSTQYFDENRMKSAPHPLSDALKGERVNLPRRLLRMPEVQRDRAWYDIVTLDESWFYLSTDYEFVWLPRDKKVPERERHTIQSKKFMFTIVWNPRGFHSIKVLEKGGKFHAGHYIAEILESLSQWRSIEAAGNERKLLMYADNVRPHVAKLSTQYFNENRAKSAPHPPYSPDLARSDFYLFGHVKRCLAGLSSEDAGQFHVAVEDVLEGIEK